MEGEGEETHVPIRAHAPVLGRALCRIRVLGLVLDHDLAPHGIAEGAILTSLRGMAGTVEGAEVGLGLVEEVEGEVDVADTVRSRGLVLHCLAGVLCPRADGRRATSVAGTAGAERGRRRTLCVLAVHGRDLTLVLVPALHVLARGRAPCLIPPTRDTVGAGAGVARVLDL